MHARTHSAEAAPSAHCNRTPSLGILKEEATHQLRSVVAATALNREMPTEVQRNELGEGEGGWRRRNERRAGTPCKAHDAQADRQRGERGRRRDTTPLRFGHQQRVSVGRDNRMWQRKPIRMHRQGSSCCSERGEWQVAGHAHACTHAHAMADRVDSTPDSARHTTCSMKACRQTGGTAKHNVRSFMGGELLLVMQRHGPEPLGELLTSRSGG